MPHLICIKLWSESPYGGLNSRPLKANMLPATIVHKNSTEISCLWTSWSAVISFTTMTQWAFNTNISSTSTNITYLSESADKSVMQPNGVTCHSLYNHRGPFSILSGIEGRIDGLPLLSITGLRRILWGMRGPTSPYHSCVQQELGAT